MAQFTFGLILLVTAFFVRLAASLVIFVPTEGGMPLLNLGDLRRNLQQK